MDIRTMTSFNYPFSESFVSSVHVEPARLSIIVPVFNEADVLPTFHKRLQTVLRGLSLICEVIYINDGSSDDSANILRQLTTVYSNITVIEFSRNFGKEQAMSAGLAYCSGDAAVILDADLQDPPELIPMMVNTWQAGAEVVNMQRQSRAGETWLKKITSRLFYRIMNGLSDVYLPPDVGDFRLLGRASIDAINSLPEKSRYMKGIFAWVGFSPVTLMYERDARAAGVSKWNYWKLWNFAIEAITGFSTIPLKVASYIGLLSAVAALFYAIFFVFKTLFIGESVAGFPTLIVTISFLGGLQLMAIGILGEYMSRLFIESKKRPLYIVKNIVKSKVKPMFDDYRKPDKKNPTQGNHANDTFHASQSHSFDHS